MPDVVLSWGENVCHGFLVFIVIIKDMKRLFNLYPKQQVGSAPHSEVSWVSSQEDLLMSYTPLSKAAKPARAYQLP